MNNFIHSLKGEKPDKWKFLQALAKLNMGRNGICPLLDTIIIVIMKFRRAKTVKMTLHSLNKEEKLCLLRNWLNEIWNIIYPNMPSSVSWTFTAIDVSIEDVFLCVTSLQFLLEPHTLGILRLSSDCLFIIKG